MTKGDNFNKSDDFKIGMHIYMWFLIICLSLKEINATAAGKCQMLTTDSQMISSLTKYNLLGHVKTQPLEPFTFKPHGQVHTQNNCVVLVNIHHISRISQLSCVHNSPNLINSFEHVTLVDT